MNMIPTITSEVPTPKETQINSLFGILATIKSIG